MIPSGGSLQQVPLKVALISAAELSDGEYLEDRGRVSDQSYRLLSEILIEIEISPKQSPVTPSIFILDSVWGLIKMPKKRRKLKLIRNNKKVISVERCGEFLKLVNGFARRNFEPCAPRTSPVVSDSWKSFYSSPQNQSCFAGKWWKWNYIFLPSAPWSVDIRKMSSIIAIIPARYRAR